jgi:hypothetical protein
MAELTTSQVAAHLGVGASTVRLWCTLRRFPGAHEIQTPRGPVWLIPEEDLAGFVVPKRGRPRKAASAARDAGGEEKAA